tara:strand:- start:5371 stop:5748 length:378 start_codon:yes stop_codon:yes gene_type:complete
MTDVQGYIKDKETKEALVGASVVLEDMYHGDMVGGTITDTNGFFALEKRGGTIAKISYPGYLTTYPILYSDKAREYFIVKDSKPANNLLENSRSQSLITLSKIKITKKAIILIIVIIAIYILTNK